MNLARTIRDWRTKAAVTQEELAKRLGVRQGKVSDMERGQTRVKADTLIRIAMALGVEPHEFGELVG